MPAKVFERDTISDDYTYATVEETGIPGLGNIYITEEQKEELMKNSTNITIAANTNILSAIGSKNFPNVVT